MNNINSWESVESVLEEKRLVGKICRKDMFQAVWKREEVMENERDSTEVHYKADDINNYTNIMALAE